MAAVLLKARQERKAPEMCAALNLREDSPLRWDVSDAELEIAADESAMSYTVQTSEYYPCCQ